MKKWLVTIILLTMAALMLAACGSGSGNTNTASTNEPVPAASGNAAGGSNNQSANAGNAGNAAAGDQAAAAQPVTVKHARGEYTFDSVPQKIVVLEWALAEDVMALGVQPVGVADIQGYNSWVKAGPAFAESVVDVGTRQEPNLETIASLQPDLILTVDFRSANSYEMLQGIAPTIVFGSEFEENLKSPYSYMINTFNTIAEVLGKQEEAAAVLAQLESKTAEVKQRLKDAGKEGAPFVITQAWSNQNAAVMRLFTDNSMAVELFEQAGLQNAFEPAAFQPNGYETVSVEALPQVQDANFFYVAQDNDNVFETILKDNPVWEGLNFVKENRTYPLGGDMWLFGGPLSAELVLDKAAELLIP